MTDTTPAQAATPEPQTGDGQQREPEQSQTGQTTTWTPEAAAAEIKALRAEAAKYRKERETAVKAVEETQRATLAEQGKYKELYEAAQSRIAALEPMEARVTALTEATQAANERRIAAIPETMRTLVPEYDDPFKLAAWLDANAATFAKSPAPSLDGRAGQGGQPAPAAVTEAQVLEFAQRMGVRPEYVDRAALAKSLAR